MSDLTTQALDASGGFMTRRYFWFSVVFAGVFLFSTGCVFSSEPSPNDPIYIRTDNVWKGLYGHGDEYAEFLLKGKDVELQDAYHVLLKQSAGMMIEIAFADKKEFGSAKDLLAAHAQWELNYWRGKASKVEGTTREDLSGARKDLKVTEIKVYSNEGARITYLIGLGAHEGVFVLAMSPVDKSVDSTAKEIINSFALVHKKLDAAEIERVSKLSQKQ
jgi:hypothetical protein